MTVRLHTWAFHSGEWMGTKMEPYTLALSRIERENSYPSPSKWIRVSLQRGRTKPIVQVLLQEKKLSMLPLIPLGSNFIYSFNTKDKHLHSGLSVVTVKKFPLFYYQSHPWSQKLFKVICLPKNLLAELPVLLPCKWPLSKNSRQLILASI